MFSNTCFQFLSAYTKHSLISLILQKDSIQVIVLYNQQLRARWLLLLEQQFSVFKQHYTYFHILFHPHVFPKNTDNITRAILPNEPLEIEKY